MSPNLRRGRCPHRPKGNHEFAGNFRINRLFCRGDVGIAPYAMFETLPKPVRTGGCDLYFFFFGGFYARYSFADYGHSQAGFRRGGADGVFGRLHTDGRHSVPDRPGHKSFAPRVGISRACDCRRARTSGDGPFLAARADPDASHRGHGPGGDRRAVL